MSYYASRVLLSVVGIITAIGPYLADWNETHIYNPTWPGNTIPIQTLIQDVQY